MIKVEFEGNGLDFKIDIPINQFAKMIKEDIEMNLNTGVDIKGNPVKPKKRSNNKPIFENTGRLKKSVTNKKINPNEYEISIGSQRLLVGGYLNYGTSKMPQRQFFGISNRLLSKVEDLLSKIKI